MNTNSQNPSHGNAEETLRLIASLPAPEGLEGRIHAALRTAPHEGRLLAWPAPLKQGRDWMRTAAAAAIAFVIAGGGWSVYRQVAPLHTGNRITLAPHGVAPGGFSGAGAIRTPQTLNGPVLTHPVETRPVEVPPLAAKNGKKTAAQGSPASAANGLKKSAAAQPAAQNAQ
jgi:hypothetical protein